MPIPDDGWVSALSTGDTVAPCTDPSCWPTPNARAPWSAASCATSASSSTSAAAEILDDSLSSWNDNDLAQLVAYLARLADDFARPPH